MKLLLFMAVVLLNITTTQAKSYYISSGGNNANNGLTPATSWQTISKVNGAAFAAGDSILFKRGDTFYGSIIVNRSNLFFDAYGTGAQPVITGFTTLSGWTNSGGGTWKKNIPGANNSLLVVAINKNLQRLGRYPNADAANGGYLSYESVNAATPSITDKELNGATNWAGAEIAIRKMHWIIDRCRVKAQSGGTISYTDPAGSSNIYSGKAGYGYFFQDDIRTLDQFGEWFLNKSTKDLSMYFGAANPATYTIQVATADTLFSCGGGASGQVAKSNITVQNIAFEGANKTAFFAWDGTNIKVKNCTFNNNNDGIFMWNIANSLTDGNTITNCLNNGIGQHGKVSSLTVVQNNTVRKCGLFAGMGSSGDGSYSGIRQDGNNSKLEYNRVDSVGYIGLEFQNNNIAVRYNYITNFCMTKDDGGGIYTWSNNGKTTYSNRVVSNNIVIGGIGAPMGTPGITFDASCIYMDGGANNVDIFNNTLSEAANAGILANNIVNIKMWDNTIYDVPTALSMQRFPGSPVLRNISFTKNISYPTKSNIFYWNAELNAPTTTSIQNDMRAIGTFDSNYYKNDVSAQFDWFYHLTPGGVFVDPASLNLQNWKTYISQDQHSKDIPIAPSPIADNTRFEFNATNSATTVDLSANYIGADSVVYNGAITLQPYTSAILIKTGATAAPLKADAGSDISLYLPINTTVLNGKATGDVSGYRWTKIAGPAQFTIANPTNPTTEISNLSAGKYTFQFKVVSSTGDSALALVNVTTTGVLPVTLIDFSAKNDKNKIFLEWKVTEINVSHYTIERSSNGQNFDNIGRLNSNDLNSTERNYNFADNYPSQGKNYYRLVMVDKDGAKTYSKTISVSVETAPAFTLVNLAVSSINRNIKIGLNSSSQQVMNLQLADVSGRIVYTTPVPLQRGLNTIDKNIPGLNAGIYYARLFISEQFVTKALRTDQ